MFWRACLAKLFSEPVNNCVCVCAAHLTYFLAAFTLAVQQYNVSPKVPLSRNVTWYTN